MEELEIVEIVDKLNTEYMQDQSFGFTYSRTKSRDIIVFGEAILWSSSEVRDEDVSLEEYVRYKFKKLICDLFEGILNTENDFNKFIKEFVTILFEHHNQ